MSEATPWQIKMFNKSLKKRMKVATLAGHLRSVGDKRCLLLTCGDNNGAMNYQIRKLGGAWTWADMEGHSIPDMESLLGEKVLHLPLEDGRKWPIEDGAFECVVAIDCHEHLDAPKALNLELARITRPGGTLIVTTPNGNERKLAVRIKHMVGMTKEKYGHKVVGYDIPDHERMLSDVGLRPVASSSYSRFFTEMLELCINFAYVNLLSKKKEAVVPEGTIAPTTQDQFKSINKTYKIYSMIYPFFWLASKLDYLLLFTRGYAVVVEARK
ncbi:MAG: methyltransferase domain-containing protein [Acidobacteria bacterium]|nr:methyltransferase domain-containing protein [Acidobacteriota bacterium]